MPKSGFYSVTTDYLNAPMILKMYIPNMILRTYMYKNNNKKNKFIFNHNKQYYNATSWVDGPIVPVVIMLC